MMSTNKGVLTSRLIVRSNTDLQENIIESRQIYSVHCEKASCENGVTVGGLVLPKLDITVWCLATFYLTHGISLI